jgi:YggT family protein
MCNIIPWAFEPHFMFYQITALLLEIVVGLVAGTALLRLYMHYQRVPLSPSAGGVPIGRFIFALTDWIVLPLRRVVPAVGRWDSASMLAAYLLKLAQVAALWLLAGGAGALHLLPVSALFGLMQLAISGLMGLLVVYAVLSWVPADRGLSTLMDRLCSPLLRPVRRVVPLIGGVDLSPLVALVALQVLLIVLGHLALGVMQALV